MRIVYLSKPFGRISGVLMTGLRSSRRLGGVDWEGLEFEGAPAASVAWMRS